MANIVEFICREDLERRDHCREIVELASQYGIPELIEPSIADLYEYPAPRLFRFRSKAQ